MVDAEALIALQPVRNAAIDTFPTELPLEMWLIGARILEGTGIGVPLVELLRKEQRIKEVVHPPAPTRPAVGALGRSRGCASSLLSSSEEPRDLQRKPVAGAP